MNDDLILKYLSDTLSDEEKNKFEAELKNDPLAAERFEEIRSKFAEIRELANVEPNGAYFDSIDANSIAVTKRKSFVRKGYSFAASLAVVTIIFFIVKGFFVSETETFMFSEEELRIVNQLTEYDVNAGITLYDFSKYEIEKIAENFDEEALLENIDDTIAEFYYVYSQNEHYLAVSSEVTEEDFSDAINELSNVKF